MKKIFVNCIVLLCIILYSCQPENITIDETAKTVEKENITQKSRGYSTASESNELVILYLDGTTEAEKIIKRQEYNVVEYKKCECADPNLELWIFDKDEATDGGLEEKKGTAKADEEIEGAEYNPNIQIQDNMFVGIGGITSANEGIHKRISINEGVTIAVLDTGVMYDYPGFTKPFLYNSGQNGCHDNGYNELFGWNFVGNNNNPYDDHNGRHGTIVTKLIMSKLDAANVAYQILPVKVANRYGHIRYFDALCGFQYAAKKPDVAIINMSFGWYHHERQLLQKFIYKVKDEILVITSAGNNGVNTDDISHYPSAYNNDNIVSVTGLRVQDSSGNTNVNNANVASSNGSSGSLADFSNRGQISVDIAAPGEYIPFMYNNEVIYLNGTSYSAALASGYTGSLFVDGITAPTLKARLISNCIYNPDLYKIKYAKHIP